MYRNRILAVAAGIVAISAVLVILQVMVMPVLVAEVPAHTEAIAHDVTPAPPPVGSGHGEPLADASSPVSSEYIVASSGGAISLGILLSLPLGIVLIGAFDILTNPRRKRVPRHPDHEFYVQAFEFVHGHRPAEGSEPAIPAGASCLSWPRCGERDRRWV